MKKPNFFVIGQMRGGSTFLYSLLKPHSQVFLPELKETRFFNHDFNDPERASKVIPGRPVTLEDYLGHYQPAGPEHLAVGDISPQYIQSPYAAAQIHEFAPQARIATTLRNPADRMHSMHYLGNDPERQATAFMDQFRHHADSWPIQASFTARNLQRYFDLFPRSHILTLRFEDLIQDSDGSREQVFNFLGLDPNAALAETVTHKNANGIPRHARLDSFFRNARKVRWIKPLIPRFLQDAGRNLWHATLDRPPTLSAEDRNEVMAFYRDDTLRLQDLLDMDFSGWLPS